MRNLLAKPVKFFSLFFLLLPFVASWGSAETKVGVILPMTGDFARYGEKVKEGLETIGQKDVRLIYEDEGCSPKLAVTSHQKLTSADGVKLLIGPWCGSPQVVVASLIARHNQLAILGSSAPRRVFELSKGRMFSVQHSIEQESIYNAEQAYKMGVRTVAMVFLENDFSRAHEAAFRASFKGKVLDSITYSGNDASALRSIATKIKQLHPDAVYLPDAAPLMHGITVQLANLGVTNVKLFSVYSAQSDDVLKAVGKSGEGMFLSYPRIEDEALHHFPRLATQVLETGLKACPNGDPECVIRSIKEKYKFDSYGVLEGEVGLKLIKDGKFVWFN